MTVILCGNKRTFITCWAACLLLNGLETLNAETDFLENTDLVQNVQSATGIHNSSDRKHDINVCHEYCYNRNFDPKYCDPTRTALKRCKNFGTECQKTLLNNQTEFDVFANTVICKYVFYMIATCSFDNVSTNYNSTILQDRLQKKRVLKNENSGINEKKYFYNELMTMAPVTDLYTGFTYANEEVYKLYAENRSQPISWNIRLNSDRDEHLYMFDSVNKCLNTTYFHSMNLSFLYPDIIKTNILPSCALYEANTKFSVDLWLENTELTLDNSVSWNNDHPSGWSRIQCNVLKTSYQENICSCQVKKCNRQTFLHDGQCKEQKNLVLAFPVAYFLDFDHL
ncbi:hypothetical protein BgiBS90_011670 [Biomphalaria glabrata]|nr:hypothetical protein BgiBS90_011670 [Biomphalaria glabrata]